MTSPETLKPDELVLTERLREIYHSSDHERGCQGREYACTCGYDDRNNETAWLAENRILDLQSDLERVTAECSGWKDIAMSAPHNAVVNATWEVLGGQDATREGGQSLVWRVTELRDRALTAEAALVKARTALEPFERAAKNIPAAFADTDIVSIEIPYTMDKAEIEAIETHPRGGKLSSNRASLIVSMDGINVGHFRALSGEEENGQ